MAKYRMVNTRFWSDSFIRENLNPLDRYLFLYFLTNDKTNISGIYELPISIISSETGLESITLKKMMRRLKEKVFYYKGWVILKNFSKYQNLESDTVKKGIEESVKIVPSEIKQKIQELGWSIYGIDTIPIQPEEFKPQSKSESQLQSESESKEISNASVAEEKINLNPLIELFKSVNPTYERLYSDKTQRASLDRLVKKFTYEKVESMIKFLPQIFGKPYAPQITTPYLLEKKLADLISYQLKQQKENNKNKTLIL